MESECRKGALSHNTTRRLQEELPNTDPDRRVHSAAGGGGGGIISFISRKKRCRLRFLQELSPNSFLQLDFRSKQTLPTASFSSIKGLVYGLCQSWLALDLNSFLSPNKPIVAGKITDFSFQAEHSRGGGKCAKIKMSCHISSWQKLVMRFRRRAKDILMHCW